MSVDPSKIKPGDEVTIRLPVVRVDGALVELADGRHSVGLIVEHHPKALSVGDRVKDNVFTALGDIVAIHGEWAWIIDSGIPCSRRLSSLERIP